MAERNGVHAIGNWRQWTARFPGRTWLRIFVSVFGALPLSLNGIAHTNAASDINAYPRFPENESGLRFNILPGYPRPGLLLAQAAGQKDANGLPPQPSADPEPPGAWYDFENEIELISTRLNNLTLGRQPQDDQSVSEQEIQLQLRYRSGQRFSALAEIKLISEQKVYADDRPEDSQTEAERGETWMHFAQLFNGDFALRLGRQNFIEPRRWWWDDDLDAARLYYSHDPLRLYIGIAEELARESSGDKFIDPDQDSVRRLFGHASWRLSESLTLGAFYLGQQDRSGSPSVGDVIDAEREDESDANLQWFGLRASGDMTLPSGNILSYWVDAAVVTGDDTVFEYAEDVSGTSVVDSKQKRRVRGQAVDLGMAWAPVVWGKPTLTLNYASGSGDADPDDDTDHSFRQTGLQDQDEEFRNYGELLRPELSNLTIMSATIGFSVHARNRVTLGHHRFRQVHRAPFLRSSRLEAEPTGLDEDIGSENRLLIEIREWRNIEIDLAAGVFTAGKAFGAEEGARANSVFGEFTFKF